MSHHRGLDIQESAKGWAKEQMSVAKSLLEE
jgi:hypothetical protein